MASLTLKQRFFDQIADPVALLAIFDHLPDVFLFVKDLQSRMIAGSSNFIERLGLADESEMLGQPDDAFFLPHIARAFRDDDMRVMETGEPMLNRLEAWYDEQRNLGWFITSKLPLRNKKGEIFGLIGVTRQDESRRHQLPDDDVSRIIAFIRSQVHRVLSPTEVAKHCALSERSLYRKVERSLGVSPYELILRTRIQKAAEALIETTVTIDSIAIAHGFCDQSTFTQHFKKRTGFTPKKFRDRYRARPEQ